MLLGSRQADAGHVLENIVYLELLRRGYDVYVEKSIHMKWILWHRIKRDGIFPGGTDCTR